MSRKTGKGSDDQAFRASDFETDRLDGRFRLSCELELGSLKHALLRLSGSY